MKVVSRLPFILSILLLSILDTAAQQDSFKSQTYLGLQTGWNLCYTNFIPAIGQEIYAANNTGLVFRHVSEPRIGLQLEVNFAHKGWIEKRDSVADYKRVMQTVDVPMLAVFLFGKKKMKFAFSIGPYLSYRRKETENLQLSDSASFRPYYLKPLEDKWEFGLMAGLGLELHSRIGVFAIRGSYHYGLTNLFPLNVPEFYYENSRMQMINAGFLYMVNL